MATYNSSPGTRFAQSKFLFNHYISRINDQSSSCLSPVFDEYIVELMETLRLHINSVLRLPLPAQK